MSPETPPQSPPNGKFDPFSSSWLYPKEWNLSDLQDDEDCGAIWSPGSSESRPGMDGSNPTELPDDQLAADKAQMMPDSYEPFQELRTIPSGWDLS